MRVASSDWCPSRKVVSVNLMGFFPAISYSFVVSYQLSAISFQPELKN
jgi:hypothetical protein